MSFPKKLLTFLVVVVLLLAGITIAANFLIQSSTVQEQLHQQAEKMLGLPIKMGRVSFNPFTGLHLAELEITDASHRTLEVTSLDFMPTWKLLLSRHWNRFDRWGGLLRARTVTVNHSFSFENFKAHLKKREANFSIDSFSAQMADGKLIGSFLLQQESGHSPYQLSVNFSDLSLKELLKATSTFEGKVKGTFLMKGILEDPNQKSGEGTLEVVGLQLKSGGPLAQIGQLLGIEELQRLKFNEAVATYAVTPRECVVKSVNLNSNNLMIRGKGNISYTGGLYFKALLLVNAQLQSRLQGLLPVNLLVPSNESGYVALPFEINGSLDHPHSTLLEQVPLPKINSNVQGVLRQLLNF